SAAGRAEQGSAGALRAAVCRATGAADFRAGSIEYEGAARRAEGAEPRRARQAAAKSGQRAGTCRRRLYEAEPAEGGRRKVSAGPGTIGAAQSTGKCEHGDPDAGAQAHD